MAKKQTRAQRKSSAPKAAPPAPKAAAPKPATTAAAAPKPARSAIRPVKAGTGIMAEPLSAKAVRNMPRKNAAPKPPAPKPAAPAPKAEGKTAPQLAKELRVRKAPGLVDQTNAMFRRAEQAARRAEQKARVMSRMGDVAGKIGKIGKAAGTIGRGALAGAVKGASRGGDPRTRAILGTTMGVLGAAQAASSLYDGLRPYNNTAAPKASPTPSPKPSSKASPKPSPKPSPARTPSPRPTPFAQSPEFGKQNEFLTKLSDKSYKRTADEQKAYDSIMKARANPGSGLVGAKIVGRKTVGPKKPGSKKM